MKFQSMRLVAISALVITSVTACGTTTLENDQLGEANDGMSSHSMANQIVMIKDDKSFIEQMIPHHEEAVKSAQQLLAKSNNAALKNIANRIVSTQTAEINQMKTWYKAWFGTDYQAGATYIAMMTDLNSVAAANVDRVFIEDMMIHHNSAILSANTLLGLTARPEMINLANSIINAQSKESIELQGLLNN